MSTKTQREACADLRKLWTDAYDKGRLPPICDRAPGTTYLDALVMGALIQEATQDTSERPGTLGVYNIVANHWDLLGAPTFQLTHSALAGFMLTDTSGLTWEEFKIPFPFFDVVLPGPKCPLVITVANGVETPLERLRVGTIDLPEGRHEVMGPMVRRYNELAVQRGSREEYADLVRTMNLVPYLWVQADGQHGVGIHRLFRIPNAPRTPVTELLSADPEGEWLSDLNKHTMALVCRVLMCLILWLDGSGTTTPKWDRSKLEENKAKGRSTLWPVGSEIKLPEPLREAARTLGRADRVPEPWKLQSRLLVRGHWKMQAHGPGRVHRKRIWVNPYYKGEEAGEVVQKLYTIGTET